MNAVLKAQTKPAQLLLLGVGGVGRAFLERMATLRPASLQLIGAANSRRAWQAKITENGGLGSDADTEVEALLARLHPGDVLVDASASDAVAAQHASWLARGIHVVTANKLGAGGPLSRWQAIAAAQRSGGACYGDAATVGAGLPLLRSLRSLQCGGDRIEALAGVLSGTLAWLFDGFDGRTAFSTRVQRAVAQGYAEPDPRCDLGGVDVLRKLLILSRACGVPLQEQDVRLVPVLAVDSVLDADVWGGIDTALAERAGDAMSHGEVLRFVARWDAAGARIGLESLALDDPLAGGRGCENRLSIRSSRYRDPPLLIAGPGAGTAVTAAALLDDALTASSAGAA
ncbi:MAG TPA: homoserine dehydrogenase [Arenimonas sp.]|nr:homoserine dehydrogenase [Arenimonas sp.]